MVIYLAFEADLCNLVTKIDSESFIDFYVYIISKTMIFKLLVIVCIGVVRHIKCGCRRVERIDFSGQGNLCSESSSFEGMSCQNAWDSDAVTNTIWHPGHGGEGAHTTMYSHNQIIVHKIIVKQYKEWASGYAKRMVLVMNGHTEKLSPVNNDYNTAEWVASSPITTKNIQLHIEEVGPYSGSAFGGITAIQVLGCLANGKQQTKSDDLKKFFPVNNYEFTTERDSEEDSDFANLKRSEGGSNVMFIVGGIVILLALILIIVMVVYGIKAKKRSEFNESNSPRVSIRPQSVRGSCCDSGNSIVSGSRV